VLDFGLKDREKMIRSHEEDTEPLIAEISLLAPEIDKLLDQRRSPDKENYVLRPSSCLPEVAVRDEDASSKSGNTPELPKSDSPHTDKPREAREAGEQNAVETDPVDSTSADSGRNQDRSNSPKGKTPKPNPAPQPNGDGANKEWLEQRKSTIRVKGKPYGRNHMADKVMQVGYFTERQRDVAVLSYGYDMRDAVISTLLDCDPKTVYDHRKGADSKLAKDHTMQVLLRNYKRRNGRSREEEDPSLP
jgi:DNA-binding CsgD family transcriptional regulator